MPTDLLPVTPVAVMTAWFRSERDVDWQQDLRRQIAAQVGDQPDHTYAIQAMRALRAKLFRRKSDQTPGSFPCHDLEWFSGEVTRAELETMRAIDCWERPDWLRVHDVATGHAELRNVAPITVSQVAFRLVAVAESVDAEPILMDGYHRSAALIRGGDTAQIPVYFGVGPLVRDWHFFR